jgi:hypothetical protein
VTIFGAAKFTAKCAAKDQRIHFGSLADRQESTRGLNRSR